MKLNELLKGIEYDGEVLGEDCIGSIAYDSRKVSEGACFIAIKGHINDGNQFIDSAINNGAKLIITDRNDSTFQVSSIKVKDSRKVLAIISSNFYSHPSKGINTIGVTGTNGKTTVAQIIKTILEDGLGDKCGVIGTLGFMINNDILKTNLTTPESLDVQKMLKTLINNKINNVVLEVSSHALKQHRVYTIEFDISIFTNLTQDHLDYHKTMKDYFNAKSILFSKLNKDSHSVINIDNAYGKKIYKKLSNNKISYGFNNKADICVLDSECSLSETKMYLDIFNDRHEITTNLIGAYNILNILASIGALISLGYKIGQIIDKINNIELSIPGRMELISQKKNQYIYIDYAHTPDAYYNIFSTLKAIDPNSQIISLFGCGGDRDKDKRPQMAAIAEKYCDKIIITSDNPRNEELDIIIEGILRGFKMKKHIIEKNREVAIKKGIDAMSSNSILTVLGKGRENYQIVEDQIENFSDIDMIYKYHEN